MAPMMEPTTSANAVAPKPMVSEYLAPHIRRDKTSRPLVVGAEEVLAVGRGERGVNRIGIVGGDEVGKDCDGDDRDEHDKRDARADRHVLPTTEAHFAGAGLHLLSEVATKLSHGATPS